MSFCQGAHYPWPRRPSHCPPPPASGSRSPHPGPVRPHTEVWLILLMWFRKVGCVRGLESGARGSHLSSVPELLGGLDPPLLLFTLFSDRYCDFPLQPHPAPFSVLGCHVRFTLLPSLPHFRGRHMIPRLGH